MKIEKVLIVDDEAIMRNFLVETFKREGIETVAAINGKEALEYLRKQKFDLVMTDMNLPEATGMEVLKKVKETMPETLVVVITAFGSIENAVEAMKLGAFDYLLKPFSLEAIEAILEKAQAFLSLLHEKEPSSAAEMIAQSPVMLKIIEEAKRIADSNANVFIHGESGTGKEEIARLIHLHSPRAQRPYVKVNCAAVPATLIESEFFGHEKGSFTGANARKLGRFELAHGGTLLLDEISEVPLALQPKLLRVIQEKEFERVGGTKPIHVDVRLISTSNRKVKDLLEGQILREDLFYRLNVVPIYLPPLRERVEDIVPLAQFFIEKACEQNHRTPKALSLEAVEKLMHYRWPGNVRELSNVIERAVVMSRASELSSGDLSMEASV